MAPFASQSPGSGVYEPDPQLGADPLQRLGRVRGTAIDVVRAREAVAGDRVAQAVLLVGGVLAQEEFAVDHEAGGHVELRQQVGLSQHAIRVAHARTVHRIAHPQIARMLGEEGPTFTRRAGAGSLRQAVCA
jgi:hypothetical protein